MEGPGAPLLGVLRRCGFGVTAAQRRNARGAVVAVNSDRGKRALHRCVPHLFVPLIELGLAGLAADCDAYDLVELLLVGFDGFLRTGELFLLTVADRPAILRIRVS